MKKLLFLNLLYFLQCYSIKGQEIVQNDSVIVISYSITFKLKDYQTTNTSSLIIDNNKSYFYGSSEHINKEFINVGVIKYFDSSQLLFCQPMPPKYDHYTYFSDSLHLMKWELNNDKIDLNGRVGYGATTFFRGRYYVAYYDPKIPFENGPYKFGGLPGLIIKLYDKDMLWNFELTNIVRRKNDITVNRINYVGDYNFFLSIYPEWRRRMEEKLAAIDNTDPNCPTCGSKSTHYSLEIYE